MTLCYFFLFCTTTKENKVTKKEKSVTTIATAYYFCDCKNQIYEFLLILTFFGSNKAIASFIIGSCRRVEGSFSFAASVFPASGEMQELFISISSIMEEVSAFTSCSLLSTPCSLLSVIAFFLATLTILVSNPKGL